MLAALGAVTSAAAKPPASKPAPQHRHLRPTPWQAFKSSIFPRRTKLNLYATYKFERWGSYLLVSGTMATCCTTASKNLAYWLTCPGRICFPACAEVNEW
eukprot:5267433-Amphidinium_carterae.1